MRLDDASVLLGDRLPEGSVYHLLAVEGQRLFPDDYFADLFMASAKGRPTVPARVVATTMLLQAHEGLSDREAVEHLAFDLRWKAAAGLAVEGGSFHSTVLVGVRNRLRKSNRPRRLFEDVKAVAKAAGLLRLVAGQDVAEGDDGVFRIVRRVKPDRTISTVDTEARHGHKSRNRSFDGYKAHLSVDPDDELIDEVAVTPANTPDRDAVGD